MKVIALNCSPRRNKNTATLLKEVLKGAESKGAETEFINIYDYNFKGCVSCFYCKRKSTQKGKCALKDNLTPILEKMDNADAIVLGSPIYFMNISAGMVAVLERFLFSKFLYDKAFTSTFDKQIQSGFIYTMNITEEEATAYNLDSALGTYPLMMGKCLGVKPKFLNAYNTYQFEDYSKYEADYFDEPAKRKYREVHFPVDCKKAFDMGVEFVENYNNNTFDIIPRNTGKQHEFINVDVKEL